MNTVLYKISRFLNGIYFYVYRAKQNRRAMIKNQIETLLNIRGKDMPSVEEEFGSGGINFSNKYILIP